MRVDIYLHCQFKPTIESGFSISTQVAVQTLHADSNTNHLAILGEIQPMSEEISQWKQKLPLLEENLSRKVDNFQTSIETMVSQSLLPEMCPRLSVLEGSVIDSVTQQIDNSKNSIQATMVDLSTDI